MSPQERNTWITLIANLVINAYVVFRLQAMFAAGRLDGPDALEVWGRLIIIAIVVSIVVIIALLVAFNAMFAIVSGERGGAFLSDERDRTFEMRGQGMTAAVFVLSFIACFAVLAAGGQALTAFMVLYFGTALGSLLGDLVKLASYREGG